MSSLPNIIQSENVFLYQPTASPTPTQMTIVFFITGNPGLISYYHEFLNLLCGRSTEDTATTTNEGTSTFQPNPRNCVIAGFSLGGFDQPPAASGRPSSDPSKSTNASISQKNNQDELSNKDDLTEVLYPPSIRRKRSYNLQDQIELSYARLTALIARLPSQPTSSTPLPPPKVILIGHSVGAYIALEVQRHHHHHHNSSGCIGRPFTIITSILLTPTVLNIANSPSGRLVTPLLTYLPFLPVLAQLSSSALTAFLPAATLEWVVSKVTGMRMGSVAVRATVGFLRDGRNVKQALELAGYEMREIAGVEWGEEVVGKGAARLYFWFAEGDHWVARETREEVQRRVEEGWEVERRPVVVVDVDEGLVHAWCIEQSELVARRVVRWVDEAMGSDGSG